MNESKQFLGAAGVEEAVTVRDQSQGKISKYKGGIFLTDKDWV